MNPSFPDPAAVVQKQLEAYNAHDVDALIAIYADDARQFEHPARLLASGSAQIRARFSARFQETQPRAVLLQRMVAGPMVIDHEQIISSTPGGRATLELIAMYEVREGRIAQAWFIFGTRSAGKKP